MRTPYDIIIKPVLTEKAVKDNEKNNTLVFEVAMDANKYQIKNAVEQIFNVKVEDVRTVIVKPKPKRFGFRSSGFKKAWKKAIVKVKSEKPINIAELV